MKKHLLFNLILTLVVFAYSYAAVPISDPMNPHNLSNLAEHSGPKAAPLVSGGTAEICIFCHTPHAAAADSPLWSRDLQNLGSFPVYGTTLGINFDAAAIALSGYDSNNPNYPSGASRMCLSCHDGVTAVGVLLGNKTITMEGDLLNLPTGISLDTSHPISFNYNINVLALLTPGEYTLPDGSVDTPLDSFGQMQCTTCHDPHEETSATTGLLFWRNQVGPSYYDDVCEACHSATPVTAPHVPPVP